MSLPACTLCGDPVIVALRPGELAVREHPKDMFGLPDLRQAPAVTTPEVPDEALCRACFLARYPRLKVQVEA